jgi:hypothetical protein
MMLGSGQHSGGNEHTGLLPLTAASLPSTLPLRSMGVS